MNKVITETDGEGNFWEREIPGILRELDQIEEESNEIGRKWIDPHYYCERIERRLKRQVLNESRNIVREMTEDESASIRKAIPLLSFANAGLLLWRDANT